MENDAKVCRGLYDNDMGMSDAVLAHVGAGSSCI